MPATSLAEQLQKLSVPQSNIYKEDKKKVSLLFDPNEAALKDRDTFYEIGRSGLNELIALYEGFRVYEDSLFSVTSKDFERAVQTKEVNKNLDQTIEIFLLQLSPYLLLQSSHKALEWLINRYHIHEYNQNEIMALILPYHETKIFVRIIQLLDLNSTSNRWNWLQPIQKPGLPLAKQVLHNNCVSNSATLKFIATTVLKYVNEYGERASQLNTVFAFFCSTSVGTMNVSRVKESTITALLPTLMKGLESSVVDFRSSAHIVLGYLSTKTRLKENIFHDIIDKLLTTEFGLSYDITLLINLMYTHQTHITEFSETSLNNTSIDIINALCAHLQSLVKVKINILPFTLAILSRVLPVIQKNNEEFRRFYQFPELLLDEVDLINQHPDKIVKCILDAIQVKKEQYKIGNDDGSDIEIIEEDDFSNTIVSWYSTLLKSVEQKYPEAFDKVITEELSSKNNISNRKRKEISKVLGFKPAVTRRVGSALLFENLNHVNPTLRIEAVKYICREFKAIKAENIDFINEAIMSRFYDTNVEVVAATLKIPTMFLNEVLNEVDLTKVFVNIVSKEEKQWKPIITEAIAKFCALDTLPVNQETVLALVPYLFPYDKESAEVTYQIITSPWGQKFELTKKLKCIEDSHKDNSEMLRDIIFKTLFTDRLVNFNDILDINRLNKSNTLDVITYLLLKSSLFNNETVEDITDILNLFLELFEDREIVPSSENGSFSSQVMPECVKAAKENKIIFEMMIFIFSRIIEEIKINDITKPWCNLCQTTETILVRRLYDICITGCSIPNYSDSYANLLEKLLNKFFSNAKEKFEFIANFACGHVLYASNPKDVISPELQLRSLKLLNNFLALQDNVNWIYESKVFTSMVLLNLNNPLTIIRQCTIDTIKDLLGNEPDKKKPSAQIVYTLYKELLSHQEELLLDYEQISQVIHTVLTQNTPGFKVKRNRIMAHIGVLMKDAPPHIQSELLKILSKVNNATMFSEIVTSLSSMEKVLQENVLNTKLTFNIYESKVLKQVYSQINESTVSTFSDEKVWSSITLGLKEYRECILQEDQTFISPSIVIMKQIDEDVFKKVPEEKTKDLIDLITLAGAFSNNPTISSVASKVMKKIHLNFSDFKDILIRMLNSTDPNENMPKKKKSSIKMLSYQLTETNEWRAGVTLLEYVQSKKKLTVDNSFVSILFQLLSKCLRFEEQSYVEYPKQLILSSLWYYCKKYVDGTDEDQVRLLKSTFDIDLIVQCIRGTQNPQTHHHALILLSHAAYMLPEQVLHHTMEIFTFMGSSVLRHDDAYSFQIITRIIETLVPILVKIDRNVEEYTDKELKQLQDRVVPVLRIFADVVLHVPEHRRLPLYKKLIETLGPDQFLWVFLALLLETHVAHFNENKEKEKTQRRNLADQESPINRLDFGQSILLEFSPEVGLDNFIKLIVFVKSLPFQKDENAMDVTVDPREIFSVNGHSAVQLRHYRYILITFMNTCLASSRFIQHNSQATDIKTIEGHYKSFIINILTFIQSISKIKDDKTAKYWKVILHHSYDLLDHTNNLLSAPMFISVIRGLMKHTLQTVRRKSMELLNSKIQFSPELFNEVDKELLFSLLPVLLDIVKTIETEDHSLSEIAAQELELNQQTALLSLKLLARILATENPEQFTPVLETVTEYTCNPNISGNVMASVVLCLAELCSNLKAHALASLRKFMPALIKVLKKQRKTETPELVLLSTVTAISKIIESLPLFLSPYLQKILYEYSILYVKWHNCDQDCNKVSSILSKLTHIKKKIASSIPPRVLIPVANETHGNLLEKENFAAIGPVMSVLAESFTYVTTADFTALQQDLTAFFLSALQLRSDAVEKDVDDDVIDKAEDEVVNALVCLVLKLSETSFRPFYFKIYDWAIRTNVEGHKDRAITFYRLSSVIADKLKGLFVLFAGHFIKNAAELLDSSNISKTEVLYFDSKDKSIALINYIIKTLHTVFLYDNQNFLNKDRFETLMQPVVDQLENTLGGSLGFKARAEVLLIPCITQFAVAIADDSLWKLLNYQILLKTRHNDAEIRLTALDCLVSMATQLGSNWLPLLAESVPFLAELLEDGDSKIESATKEAIRKLEQILGEPLEKYF